MNKTSRVHFIVLIFMLGIVGIHGSNSNSKVLNIAVIGAGVSGLTSAKNALEQGHKVVVYEKTGALGGTWWYTDKTGKDEYGVNIYTAMYQGLRTNTARLTMEFPGLAYPNGTRSFPPSDDIWKYLNSYADHFNLKKHIKFHHLVEKIHSIKNDKWKIIVSDLPNNKTETAIYDNIFVTLDKLSLPNYPQFEGANDFKGKIMHSHEYRRAEDFYGANVLIVGGGNSGKDLVLQLSKTASHVTWSRRTYSEVTEEERKVYGNSVTYKNDVKLLTSNGAEFVDGTHRNFTVIVCATGYKKSYSIFDADTGISVDVDYVQPLYKNIINIEHPTMAYISLDSNSANFRVKDLEVQFALKFFSGAKKLPSKSEMMKDMSDFEAIQKKNGYTKSNIHSLSIDDSKEYYKKLAEAADIDQIWDVYSNIALDSRKTAAKDPFGYRNYKYTIIDDKTFVKEEEI